jgi:hypothetical protein
MVDLPEELLVLAGPKGRIAYARDAPGRMPARDFLESDDVPQKDHAKLYRYFEIMTKEGRILNRETFKQVRGKIYGFKSYQVRLSAFQEGDIWFLCDGFIKKRDLWPPSKLDRADIIRKHHLEWWKKRKT